MTVVDAIAALPTTSADLPLRNNPTNGTTLTEDHYVIINGVEIIDAATDTAIGLTRPLTTRDTSTGGSGGGGGTNTGGGSSGGHFGIFGLLMLGAAAVRRVIAR